MKITAIIDSYNSAPYLAEAIQSVLDQTRQPDEFIVVDDESPDESVSIAREMLKEVSWARVVEKKNGGQLSCVSEGIVHSTGDLVALLDSDDIWHENHLELAEKQFLNEPKLSLYFSASKEFGEGDKNLYRSYCPKLIGQTTVLTAVGNSYVGGLNSALVARAADLKPYLPLPRDLEKDWVVNADNITIWLTSLSGGYKYASDEVTVKYRVHPTNNHKALSKHPARIHRKAATARFFEYCRSVFSIPADFGKLLPQEYRAHPNRTKELKKEYLKALGKVSHAIGIRATLEAYIRIQLAK
ncbi:glycosyltransferase family 2 protein [Rubritalea marina]|uniref:glycosyltransferase family 2 protein n=1 Tax=Rubritalea marina TaxID=361055 RepID=UPI0003675651|nr:glycosyltransferase [Rubritalea marina]